MPQIIFKTVGWLTGSHEHSIKLPPQFGDQDLIACVSRCPVCERPTHLIAVFYQMDKNHGVEHHGQMPKGLSVPRVLKQAIGEHWRFKTIW